MRKVTIITRLAALMLLLTVTGIKAQVAERSNSPFPLSYVFDTDSLAGFDEELAKQVAFNEGFFGEEFKVYMYRAKRNYINAKYNIRVVQADMFRNAPPVIAVAACSNEDFEASTPGNITSSSAVTGWNVFGGTNLTSGGSCSHAGCCALSTPTAAIVNTTGGYTDPVIGAGYPIYSVFGPTTTPNAGPSVNPSLPNMYGNTVIRLNDEPTGNYTATKLVKTFAVTSSNALFQYAFISIFYPGHACCDAPSFTIKLYNASAGNSLIPCPQATVSANSVGGCTVPPVPAVTYSTTTTGYVFNSWKLNAIDLTSYIGNNITVEVIVTDCTASGHFGCMYFDAQCGPMDIIGNGIDFPAGSTNITLPTCGAGSSATIVATPGLGPYTWTGPGAFTSTAQTIVTNVSGNYTLTMFPAGACVPTTKTVNVVISPAPNIAVSSQTNPSCSTSTNAIALTLGSGVPNTTATPNYTVIWSPTNPTGTIGVSATTGTYSGASPGVNTITVVDAVGCLSTTTVNVLTAPPIPSFSLQAPFGTVIGCNPSTITLNAINTNTTLTNMTYTWTSASTGTQTGNTIGGQAPSGPNTYTVFGSDMTAGSCITSQTITVTQNLVTPSVNVTPLTATISCNGFPKTFTATCTTPTSNIFGNWYDPSGTPMGSPSGSLIPMTTGNCGIFSVTYTNVINGCTTTKQVTVTCDPTVPTMTVNALDGYVISCLKPCLKFNISASVGPAPKTYSWTNLSTSVTVVPPSGGYTICVPGNYLAEYEDGNFCRISQQITVSIDTLRPSPTATTTLAGGSFTLSCFQPSLVATAVTTPMLPIGNYSWTVPPNLTITTPTIAIDQSSVTTSGTTFTVLATGANGCVGKTKVIFYKDIFVPPYTAVFTPSAITCSNQFVALSPQSTSTSTIPVTFTFTSPPPTTTANASGSQFDVPGTYTMTYQSLLNGCTAITTTVVPLNVVPPATVVLQPVQILCGSNTATINAGTTTQPNYYQYTWEAPAGAGMSCASCYSSSVNMVGIYEVAITNTINGCTNSNSVVVTTSTVLPVSFTADPTSGFAPLTVGYHNTTVLGSASSGTVTTSWSYGNGTAYTFTNISSGGTPNGGTTYQAPGSYTVLLVVQQAVGTTTCVGTATTVIMVDIPSELVVPNVFTPNNDGINDMFTVQSTNISDINCTIFDRWGVKMYDVTSDKGQIGWDGKSLFGKEVPAGTYFYILKATGKDGQSYEKKGTVNLYR